MLIFLMFPFASFIGSLNTLKGIIEEPNRMNFDRFREPIGNRWEPMAKKERFSIIMDGNSFAFWREFHNVRLPFFLNRDGIFTQQNIKSFVNIRLS